MTHRVSEQLYRPKGTYLESEGERATFNPVRAEQPTSLPILLMDFGGRDAQSEYLHSTCTVHPA